LIAWKRRDFVAGLVIVRDAACCGAAASNGETHGVGDRRTQDRRFRKRSTASRTIPKRSNAPTATRRASSTVADLQAQVSALTRELAVNYFMRLRPPSPHSSL
jgi:hypothetical protein